MEKKNANYKKAWSDDDKDYLLENYSPEHKEELVEYLGRTWEAIKSMAVRLGITEMNKWTPDEDKLLVEIFPNYTYDEMSKLLKRPKSGIRTRAYDLGLKREYASNWTNNEDELLKQFYPNGSQEFLINLFRRPWKGIVHRAGRLDLKRDKYWKLEEDEFLKKNYGSGDRCFIVSKLNRSWETILQRASQLGLSRGKILIKNASGSFDSYEEFEVFNFISNFNINIKRNKNKFITPDDVSGNFVPDFIINDNIIVEYYGLYKEENQNKIFVEYIAKTHIKNKYYSSLDGYDFIGIYPNDLENNFEGVYNKIKHLIKEKEVSDGESVKDENIA